MMIMMISAAWDCYLSVSSVASAVQSDGAQWTGRLQVALFFGFFFFGGGEGWLSTGTLGGELGSRHAVGGHIHGKTEYLPTYFYLQYLAVLQVVGVYHSIAPPPSRSSPQHGKGAGPC